MCGILGSINIKFDNNALELIAHRGPDDLGIESYYINDNIIQFGHRRLSILDLSPAGHQPMSTNCNEYSIVFNGEVYNHDELRDRLPKNILFKGHSDTETILYYLKEFGIEGIKDFNGIFSIAFLDNKNGKLVLARDPFGVKPLYYFIGKNSLIFSSEIRPIKHILKKDKGINKDALGTLLRLRYNPAPDTIYEGINKIRPGHYLEINLKNENLDINTHPYLKPIASTIDISSKHAVKMYGEKFEAAIKRQLLSDVDVGVLLSGGIDSALVTALAQRHYQGKLKTFTVGFEGNFSEDEIEEAAETANYFGLEHFYKRITFDDFINMMRESSKIVEEPLATTSMIPMYFLSKMASEHVKVVLTGQGADEPLGGYTRYKSEIFRKNIPPFLRQLALPAVKLFRTKNEKILRGAHALGQKNEIKRFLSSYEIFSSFEITQLISKSDCASEDYIQYMYDILNCKSKATSVERMMGIDARMNLADDLLNYTDKITMHFSIECRVPMLDLDLLDFIESLPSFRKVNLGEGKIIHKHFSKQILPRKIISRKKKAFQSPTETWFRKENEQICELLLTEGTKFSGIFNQNYVRNILDQHLQGFNKEKQIFLLLSIYFLLES